MKNMIYKTLIEPKAAFDYVFRAYKLNKLFSYNHHIQSYLNEASQIKMFLDKDYPNNNFRILSPSIIYTIIRTLKPDIIIETGVDIGISTYFILAALDRNKHGELYSIDIKKVANIATWLPVSELRWEFILGDSKKILPDLLSKLGKVDIFIHDSLHTYDHMIFEFETAWEYTKDVIMSDDIDLNKAFEDFIKTKKVQYAKFANFGVIKR